MYTKEVRLMTEIKGGEKKKTHYFTIVLRKDLIILSYQQLHEVETMNITAKTKIFF